MTVDVLLADDQELIRAGLEMIIDSTDDLQVMGRRPMAQPQSSWLIACARTSC